MLDKTDKAIVGIAMLSLFTVAASFFKPPQMGTDQEYKEWDHVLVKAFDKAGVDNERVRTDIKWNLRFYGGDCRINLFEAELSGADHKANSEKCEAVKGIVKPEYDEHAKLRSYKKPILALGR